MAQTWQQYLSALVTVRTLKFSMHYAAHYLRFLTVRGWPDPNQGGEWVEPDASFWETEQ